MPEVLSMPEFETEVSPEVAELAGQLADILDPDGPYRWDTPPDDLKVGDGDYDLFVCRTSLLFGIILKMDVLVKKHVLPEESEYLLGNAVSKLNTINSKSGKKTQADMQEIRRQFSRALIALRSA